MSAMTRYRGPRIRATKTPQQYPYMQYPYQNNGTQLTWRDSPPLQSRAGDTVGLGDYLPVPGGPEEIPVASGYSGYIEEKGLGDCGCGCKGAGMCGKSPLSGVPIIGDLVNELGGAAVPVMVVGGLGLAYLLYKHLVK